MSLTNIEEKNIHHNIAGSFITPIHQGGFVMSNLAEVMRKNVKSVKHTSRISEAAQLMKQERVSALLVKEK